MKKALFIIVLALLAFPWRVDAGVDLPYSTSALTCNDFTQNNSSANNVCDGANVYGEWMCTADTPSKGTQVTAAANYSGGAGGKGFRIWFGDALNINSGNPEFIFNSPPRELWVRYYARWQAGFNASSLMQKMIYVFQNAAGGTPSFVIQAETSNQCELQTFGAAQDVDVWYNGCGDTALGFDPTTHQNSGAWRLIEYHIKLNTSGQSDGVVEMWVNGTQSVNRTNLNFGWTSIGRILLPSNNHLLSNGACAYYDEDDIAFSTTGRIGAFGSAGSPPQKFPQPPAVQGVTP